MNPTILKRLSRREFLMTIAAGVAAASCGALLSACGGRSFPGKLTVEPNPVRVDEPFAVRLNDLSPGERVNLRLKTTDAYGKEWRSLAVFEADDEGQIDLADQAPLFGSYGSVAPMGLLWSASGGGYIYAPSLRPPPMTITAEVGEEEVSLEVERRLLTPEIESEDVREGDLYGKLFHPAGEGPAPGVLVLGGSDGGLNLYTERQAALFASHGYVALALAYFGAGSSLPKRLANIPLEYFGRAIEWLKGKEAVRGERLGVVGTSRGGELALILGSYYRDLQAVVSYVGSGVVVPSPDGDEPAWTHEGKPLPRIPYTEDPSQLKPQGLERAEIPVERINGPVLLISGADDRLWPSAKLSAVAAERLREHDHPYPYEHLSYENAGHLIGAPYLPTTGANHRYGGTPKGNAKANEDSWRRVLKLLDERLKG